ncbi:MAG: LPS assembly lipoprotein LptE [Gemmataceae bacterium]|nr:LPS assembly lipoprotein LptE [Gemmataceae bacterium]
MLPQHVIRRVIAGLLAGSLAGCASGGHVNLLGYTTVPTYDDSIRTVYVPIFQNVSFRRGLEFDVTRAVVREIEAKTPYKVVNCREEADTELTGKIINRRKQLVNQNQLGEVRDSEVYLAVELQWRDLRPGHLGEFLSRDEAKQRRDDRDPLFAGQDGRDPYSPQNLRHSRNPQTILVQPTTHFIPELGGSITTAEKQLVDRLAVQIVSMMEKW